MIDLAVTYRRLWVTRKRKGSFPEAWGEVTAPQLIALASSTGLNETRFIATMTGLSHRWVKLMGDFQRHQVLQLIDWVKTNQQHDSFIIQHIGTGNHHLVAPKPRLKDFTFGQFVFADAWYNEWCDNQNPESTGKLVASLYLKPGTQFTEAAAMANLPVTCRLPMATKEAVALNFRLVLQWLAANYPLVFSGQHGSKNSESQKKQANGWVRVFESVVGDDIVNHDRYACLPIHTVLRFLTEKTKQQQRNR